MALQRLSSYPLMTFERFLFWTVAARIRRIRPFWYLDYNKEEARALLEREYGQHYGGHHLENRITAFSHSLYAPGKFNTDFRITPFRPWFATVMDRAEAWAEYNEPPFIEEEPVEYFQKRLGISENEYARIMAEPPRDWHEFPTYKKRFERMRPVFKVLADANLVPRLFYLKYCFPTKTEG